MSYYIVFAGSLDVRMLAERLQASTSKVSLLELVHSDVRPDLARIRNEGIDNFVVDVGAKHLKTFFQQVGNFKYVQCPHFFPAN